MISHWWLYGRKWKRGRGTGSANYDTHKISCIATAVQLSCVGSSFNLACNGPFSGKKHLISKFLKVFFLWYAFVYYFIQKWLWFVHGLWSVMLVIFWPRGSKITFFRGFKQICFRTTAGIVLQHNYWC